MQGMSARGISYCSSALLKKEGQLGVGELEAGRKVEVWGAGGGSSSRGIEQGVIIGGGNFTCN